ncbi:MAG: tRNA (5-methylaminomethyl-2-thiouridine)(34)-methyltransferase MnmD [Planctomycetota bacterium]
MPIPNRRTFASSVPEFQIRVTDDGSRTLVLADSETSYHSGCGAAIECDHVYLKGVGMDPTSTEPWPNSILEIGFGTGMAMLRTLDRAIRYDQPLQYVGLETVPLPTSVLREIGLETGLEDPTLAGRFLDAWEQWIDGIRDENQLPFSWQPTEHHQIHVRRGDASHWLAHAEETFDGIYFDPFDPATQPELWARPFVETVVRRMSQGGRLATYCSKTEIRRRFEAVGLQVDRVPGPPGGKREVITCRRGSSAPTTHAFASKGDPA